PIDIQAVGFGDLMDYRLARGFSEMMEVYNRRGTASDVVDEGGGVVKVAIAFHGKVEAERTIWIDTAKDYVPLKVVTRQKGTKSGEWSEPSVTTTEWQGINGVFVPQIVRAEEVKHGVVGGVETEYHWKSV